MSRQHRSASLGRDLHTPVASPDEHASASLQYSPPRQSLSLTQQPEGTVHVLAGHSPTMRAPTPALSASHALP